MVLDTSAIIAVLRDEPEAPALARTMAAAGSLHLSTASYVEAGAVIDGSRDPVATRRLDELLDVLGVVLEPVTQEQARIARAAYRDFGRGSGHRANLDYGDAFAYALAKTLDEPLLFKGDDFGHTDVEVAQWPLNP
ncbi:MAG: type II toxin-antitoxin system VapC family toxin, partial [Trueperaceae bacterium]